MDQLQVDRFIRELELTRLEMSALTDALRSAAFRTAELTVATDALRARIEARRKGFWNSLVGA